MKIRYLYATMRLSKSFVLMLIIGLIALAGMTNNASACSINPNFQPPPISERVDGADIVVIGKVIGGGLTEGTISGSSTILVEKYLKGSGPDILFTKSQHMLGLMSCDGILGLWSKYVFYYQVEQGTVDPSSLWHEWECAGRENLDSVTITEIRNYTGRLDDPSPSPFIIHVTAFLLFFTTFEVFFITWFILVPVAILAFIFLVQRALRRRKQLKLAKQV